MLGRHGVFQLWEQAGKNLSYLHDSHLSQEEEVST